MTRSSIEYINARNRAITVLQRMAVREGEDSEQARRLLGILKISDKSSEQLIDEIVEKKGEGMAENDLRMMLKNRTHLELVRFRAELD